LRLGVPFMTIERERQTLSKYHASQTDAERTEELAVPVASIDGLPVRLGTVLPDRVGA
jgi:flagellar motor switch protein FliM